MSTATKTLSHGEGAARNEPRFIFHASFEEPGAEEIYGGVPADNDDESLGFMPDDVTRDCTKSMHYAAWRACGATTRREAARWRRRYFDCRDRIVLGNRKLTFRAVQMWRSVSQTRRRHGGRVPDRPDQGRRCLQSVAGHSLQHLRLHLPDARPVPAVAAPRRRPVVPVPAAGVAALRRAVLRQSTRSPPTPSNRLDWTSTSRRSTRS